MKKNAKIWLSLVVLFVGIFFTLITYFSTAFASKPIAVITDSQIKDTLVDKTKDNYENKDEVRQQNLHLKILSGKYKGKTFLVTNTYSPSQAVSQKYRPHQRVIVSFIKGKPKLVEPKRDWVVVLSMFLTISVIVLITGKQASLLLISMILNSIIFYFVIKSDVKENGTRIFLIYSIAAILFTFVSLVIVQGFNQKMLVTLTATLLGVFVSFGIFYLVMRVTHERGIDYEAVDYATQDPRALFLSQTILGVLGAVMDEATDIVSSLYALAKHKADLTFKELFISGRTLGQEIMGPLINVLVLIFMAEALPMTILYLRDNNTLVYTFKYTLSLGVIQSLSSAIGIVLTALTALLLILLILMIIVGGKTGFKSYLSVVINACLLILVALLISWGVNIVLVGAIFIPLKLLTIIYLGTHDYTVAKNAFLTALCVSVIVMLIIILFENLAQTQGFGDQAGEELIGLSLNVGISFSQIAILVAIFSMLGAIAEASVAMSAGLLELKRHDPNITQKQLIESGNEVGADVLGTAMNTILFGLFGSFLPIFIWYMRLNYSLFEILNDKLFVDEFLIIVYSFIGVLLTVPLTTIFLAHTLTNKENKK